MSDLPRAMSIKQAKENGLNAKKYIFKDLPSEFTGVLEFKVWGKSSNLRLFFKTEEGKRYVISAFFPAYAPKNMPEFDLSKTDIQPGMNFQIKTEVNKNGNTKFIEAHLI